MVTPVQVLEVIRSISFGALVVNAVLITLFLYYPGLFPQGVTFTELLYIGTALGTALHRGIHLAFFNPLTASIAKSFSFYAKYLEVSAARKNNVIDEEEFERYSSRLKEGYYGTMGVDAPEKLVMAGKRDSEFIVPEREAEKMHLRIGRTSSMKEVLVLADQAMNDPFKTLAGVSRTGDTAPHGGVEGMDRFDPANAGLDDADDTDELLKGADDSDEESLS